MFEFLARLFGHFRTREDLDHSVGRLQKLKERSTPATNAAGKRTNLVSRVRSGEIYVYCPPPVKTTEEKVMTMMEQVSRLRAVSVGQLESGSYRTIEAPAGRDLSGRKGFC